MILWLVSRTATDAPYPCRCGDQLGIHFGRHECGPSSWAEDSFGSSCACWGRLDLTGVPNWCCGRRKVWPGNLNLFSSEPRMTA